jgi:PRTRC genetic system protein C
MARQFIYDGRTFPDPDPRLSVEDVQRQLSDYFPELVNVDTREETRGDDTLYMFARRIGTKGGRQRRPPDIVQILRRVPSCNLRVFELAAVVLQTDGTFDVDAAARRQPDLALAEAEADAYARATQSAVNSLRRLPAR